MIIIDTFAEGSTFGKFSVASVVAVYLIYWILFQKPVVPLDLPWVGKSSGIFAESKASLAVFTKLEAWLEEGYRKYSKKGRAYILPGFGGRPEILLPPEKLQWLMNRSDDEASVAAAHYDKLAGRYAFTDPYILKTVYYEHVIYKNLVRKLGVLIPHTWDEMQFQLDKFFGHDSEQYQEIALLPAVMRIVASVSNRMFVGKQLCRNDDFLQLCERYAQGVGIFSILWALVPGILRPLVGPLMAGPLITKTDASARGIGRYTMPIVLERLADISYNATNPEMPRDVPDDYITWHIRQAKLEERNREQDPDMVCKSLLPVEFAAIHTTTFTLVNILLDLAASDPSLGYLEGIREEVERVYADFNGEWTKQALAKLIRTDSAIKESMRVSTFLTRAIFRKVLKPDGLRSEEGWVAPRNSSIGFDVWSRHHDPDIYSDPFAYDAFRFSRKVEASETYLDAAKLSFVNTGENFLSFGHGRHACPGRFFVNLELKLMLAYLVMNYDIQHLPERPKMSWGGGVVLPPNDVKMAVKRRTI